VRSQAYFGGIGYPPWALERERRDDGKPGRLLVIDELARPPTPAPRQAVRLGAESRAYGYRDTSGKERSRTLRHVWMVCDACGEGLMREKNAGPRACAITAGCPGKHQP
jgi:hypothetical protein